MKRDVDEEAIEKRLQRDSSRVKQLFSELHFDFYKNDKISGTQIFPLTLDILNEEEDPFRILTCKTGEKVPKPTFYGACPELESFFSVPLYLTEKSNSSTNAYIEIQDYFQTADREKFILCLEGNYSITPPNKLNIWRGKITRIPREKNRYDWYYAPFLKVNGETFGAYISPIYYQEILLPNEKAEFIPYKAIVDCIAAYILDKNGTILTLKLPSFRTDEPIIRSIRLEENIAKHHQEFQRGDLVQALVFRKMYKKNKNLIEETTIGKITKIPEEDVVLHLLIADFYYQYLENASLKLFTYSKLKEYFIKAVNKTQAFLKRHVEIPPALIEYMLSQYLNTYFRNIENTIYYIPYLFRKYSNQQILKIEQTRALLADPQVNVVMWKSGFESTCSRNGKIFSAQLCNKEDYRSLMIILRLQQELRRTAIENIRGKSHGL
jgi:hypothetical protein